MSEQDRRQFVKSMLAQLAKAAGGVVLATSVLSKKVDAEESSPSPENRTPEERAVQLAEQIDPSEVDAPGEAGIFRRGGFRRGGGGFRRGGFRRLGGGFVNGGFRRF